MSTTVSHERTPRKAALASFMGSAVEYYDFFLFGAAAALIFPHVFFPDADTSALVMSFATFAFAYVARPVGAVILGHYGDRIGRQRVLMFTLVLMGVSTFTIGLLPTFDQIGWAAPALLVLCRLAQGLSASGEQAGASSLTLEHARTTAAASSPPGPSPAPRAARSSPRSRSSPSWRCPRRRATAGVGGSRSSSAPWSSWWPTSSAGRCTRPRASRRPRRRARSPSCRSSRCCKNHWRDVLRVILCAFIAAVSTVFGNLAIAYGKTVGLNTAITLWLVVAANFCALFTQPLFGKLADRIGRKPVFIYGAASSAVMMPFYLLSMSQGNEILTFALAIATFSCGYAAANAVWPSFYGEMFSTKVRFSGMAIGTQLGFLMAGFAPTIVTAFGGVEPGGWVVSAIFTGIIATIAIGAALTARETKNVPTAELGLRPAEVARRSELISS